MPLNIERRALDEMHAAEDNGTFEYDPEFVSTDVDPNDTTTNRLFDLNAISNSTETTTKIEPNANDVPVKPSAKQPSPPLKRKNSLDEFELEIEGINLDDNIDTSVS